MVDLHPQDPPEQVGAQAHRPDDHEQRGDELDRLPRAGEREHDREHRERQAVGEVGHDVRPARGGDGEEGAVQRERDREREEDRRHATRSSTRIGSTYPSARRCSGDRVVDPRGREGGQLGQPAAYVVALRIVEPRLADRVESPVRPRVGAGARDPLPVAAVRGGVSVEEVLHEVRGADAPVDPELLDEEGGGDEPLAVGDPALGEQLAHRGVDERVAGVALLPRGDRVGVVAPDAATRIHVAPLQFGRRREELGEEVAPAQLSEHLLGGAVGYLGRRDRAEVEVG